MSVIENLRKPERVRRNIVIIWLCVILGIMVVYAFASGSKSTASITDDAQTGYTQTGGSSGSGSDGGSGCACCGGGNQAEIKGQAIAAGDRQEVTIKVQGGYDPNTIEVKKGLPLRITFERKSTNGCDKQIVFPSLGIAKDLPDDGSLTLDIPIPDAAGQTIDFTCGMSMLFGKIVVVE